ncbi:MAG: hypothetical protein IPM82_13515 [Saprospiraceae bacterium]|nr:hypothetical protein [Saprospiraceae bacterium]
MKNFLTMQTKIKSTSPTFMVALLVAILVFCTPLSGQHCGPVIISGLDTEFGFRSWPTGPATSGPTPWTNSHGDLQMWANVIQTGILNNVTANPTGPVLVIGGSTSTTDAMHSFWNQVVGTGLLRSVVYSNSSTGDILTIPFTGYSMIAICNTADGTGKLTASELLDISARQADIASFVNSGGGLFASSCNIAPFYGYINIGIPPLVSVPGGGSNSTPTALGGLGIGGMGIPPISGPYHNTFTQWPSFLNVLSTLPPDGTPGTGPRPCILGGKCVTIPGESKFRCPGENLVNNGDFEGGNTGFTSAYIYNSTVAAGATLPDSTILLPAFRH